MLCRRAHWAILPLLLLRISACAATIHLTEPPDFPNYLFIANFVGSSGTLDIGTNTITGSVNGTPAIERDDFADFFILNLPSGLAITSAQIQITGYTNGGGSSSAHGTFTNHGSATDIPGDATYPLSSYAIPGDFVVSIRSTESLNRDSSGVPDFIAGAFAYTLTYNVEAAVAPSLSTALPLPTGLSAGAIMLPLTLAALALHRRRQPTA